jgi:hypothetical protein
MNSEISERAVFVGRSTVEIYADRLIKLCEPIYNVSRREAQERRVYMRAVNRQSVHEAKQLVLVWEGTPAQLDEVDRLACLALREIRLWGRKA